MLDKQELARLFQKRDELYKQVQLIDLAIKDAVGFPSQKATSEASPKWCKNFKLMLKSIA